MQRLVYSKNGKMLYEKSNVLISMLTRWKLNDSVLLNARSYVLNYILLCASFSLQLLIVLTYIKVVNTSEENSINLIQYLLF